MSATKIYFGLQLLALIPLQLIAGAFMGFSGSDDTLQALLTGGLFFSAVISLVAFAAWGIKPELGFRLHVLAMVVASISALWWSPPFLLALFISMKIKDKILPHP